MLQWHFVWIAACDVHCVYLICLCKYFIYKYICLYIYLYVRNHFYTGIAALVNRSLHSWQQCSERLAASSEPLLASVRWLCSAMSSQLMKFKLCVHVSAVTNGLQLCWLQSRLYREILKPAPTRRHNILPDTVLRAPKKLLSIIMKMFNWWCISFAWCNGPEYCLSGRVSIHRSVSTV